ncbi:MAG TPA: NAD(P)-binding domain-containing protein, partial [Polyangiaceae bacterium]|nr:NAD(P)-binding domain-containing protein [Polyangiaceae bacterium]
MKKVAVVGSGVVGQALADGFLKHGYEVIRASRDPSKLADWKKGAGAKAATGTPADATKAADLVVLAVKGAGAEEAVAACADGLSGKTVLDTTNPISNAPPTHGVLSFFTSLDDSLMERLQRKAPKAHFVK